MFSYSQWTMQFEPQIYIPWQMTSSWHVWVHRYTTHKELHGPLTRYVKLQVAHAPGMPGTFSPAADFKGNRKLAIPTCITARAWRTCRDACRDRAPAVTGKTFPAFPAHAHLQFCVSGKRPMHCHNVLSVCQYLEISKLAPGPPFTNVH